MEQRFIVIGEKITPDIYLKVLEAKDILLKGEVKSVTEAVKKVGISRSAYYKYHQYLFRLSDLEGVKKATVNFLLGHRAGILAEIINCISEAGGSILTINQNIPIDDVASLSITFDINNLNKEVDEIIEVLNNLDEVVRVELVSMGY